MSDYLPCPLCGSEDLSENSWYLDDAEGPFSEVPALECTQCKAGAPVESWQRRPDPWRYPPDLPEMGQHVVLIYERDDGRQSRPVAMGFSGTDGLCKIVRWMAIPEVSACQK